MSPVRYATSPGCETVAALPPAAAGALAFWVRLRGTQALPRKADFSPLEWRTWLSDISTIEIREGEKRYFIALHGGRTQDYVGTSFHKRYLEDCVTPETLTRALAPYRESERTGLPVISTLTPVIHPGEPYGLSRLVLPFTDDTPSGGPERVDRFIVWVGVESRKPYDLKTVYTSLQANLDLGEDIADRIGLRVLSV